MFDELKIAQATAYLLHKAGGTMEHIKVMKLLYLADRLSWQRYGYSISNDEYYSLPYGPVLSNTLNLIRGEEASLYQKTSIWGEWIADKEDHKISLKKSVNTEDEYFFDCLSESDTEILEEVFATFGNYKPFALVEYTHNPKYIPEWEDPQGRSKPISLSTLLTKLGKTPSEIESILEQQAEKGTMDNLFKGLGNA
ncbi:Panacea domain-containing protein [Mannheimia haemolytica]|nr:Panacea domain-containing protein [Mannheimia haemolytica]MDW1161226.1 Panacea domain-containing protein [Mannheimia haemolytica]HDZ6746253.1 SocA family protein [Mannheimia haemolytica]